MSGECTRQGDGPRARQHRGRPAEQRSLGSACLATSPPFLDGFPWASPHTPLIPPTSFFIAQPPNLSHPPPFIAFHPSHSSVPSSPSSTTRTPRFLAPLPHHLHHQLHLHHHLHLHHDQRLRIRIQGWSTGSRLEPAPAWIDELLLRHRARGRRLVDPTSSSRGCGSTSPTSAADGGECSDLVLHSKRPAAAIVDAHFVADST